ncbi:MAG TPA: hypothetical protein H9775_13940 [Candidatus Blautia merdipullorum]|nr:hypothetical protein [Candidatus Blautia merdipullorum]
MNDYADVLGSRLVTAIRNGTASSDQLKTAVEKIGKAAEASAEIVKNVYGSGASADRPCDGEFLTACV